MNVSGDQGIEKHFDWSFDIARLTLTVQLTRNGFAMEICMNRHVTE